MNQKRIGDLRISNRPTMRMMMERGNSPIIPSEASLFSFAQNLGTLSVMAPESYPDNLFVNSENVGKYGVSVIAPDTTIGIGYDPASYFTSVEDTESAWIICKGNLTINAATFTPPVRKLFTVLYVDGNLTFSNNGIFTMTNRGANHSGTGNSGGYTAPVDIRIANGTFSSVLNPQIPAIGGAGAERKYTDGYNSGVAGANGGTGGGGGGYWFSNHASNYVGAGSAGTCFCGGGGSGSVYTGIANTFSDDAVPNGGAGSAGKGSTPVGGVGNPAGAGGSSNSGLAGVIVVFCTGTLSGTGSITSIGQNAGNIGGITGGAGGGGSITVMAKSNPSNQVSINASGGSTRGGAHGHARKLVLP